VTTKTNGARPSGTELSLSLLLKRAVVDARGEPVGSLADAIVRLRDKDYPVLTGLVVTVRGSRLIAPVSDIAEIDTTSIRLRSGAPILRPFERREGELLLKEDVLGHRLIDVARSVLVKAHDVRLSAAAGGWAAIGLDVHRHAWLHFGPHDHHPARDWHGFVLLVGQQPSLKASSGAWWVGRLKPAQIANLIEAASAQEQGLLLAQVHADPALEASVFGELDEDKQAQLLKSRSDQDVAEVLSRMRADDVADAVMELPQSRRLKVLELLPQPQNTKVLTLLGYHPATAGGLMGTDFLAVSEEQTIADALEKIRKATTQQPEALTTIHSLRSDGVLVGTLSLVRALQFDSATLLRDAAEHDAIFASPEDDIIAVTTRMADFNLLTLPVLDEEGKILGVITVDDALEAAIPRDWSRREPGQPGLTRFLDYRREA
jgi:CBS domain-containing protein/sporulation protein YlmC with PRC-barrel domain